MLHWFLRGSLLAFVATCATLAYVDATQRNGPPIANCPNAYQYAIELQDARINRTTPPDTLVCQ